MTQKDGVERVGVRVKGARPVARKDRLETDLARNLRKKRSTMMARQDTPRPSSLLSNRPTTPVATRAARSKSLQQHGYDDSFEAGDKTKKAKTISKALSKLPKKPFYCLVYTWQHNAGAN